MITRYKNTRNEHLPPRPLALAYTAANTAHAKAIPTLEDKDEKCSLNAPEVFAIK